MNTPTSTPTLHLRVERDGGRSVLAGLSARPPLRAYVLSGGDDVRVAVLQSAAMLLAGDEVVVQAEVEEGAGLELIELASTIAHSVRGGAGQRQRVEARVASGGRLVVREEPLIAGTGCDLEREVRVELSDGAAVLWRETIVLGRHGEDPGRVRARLRAEHGGRALLDEQLDTHPLDVLRSALVAGRARVVGTVALLGLRDPDPPSTSVLELAGPGSLARALGDAVQVRQLLDPLEGRWRTLLSGPTASMAAALQGPARTVPGRSAAGSLLQ
jgi:urease accessory protein